MLNLIEAKIGEGEEDGVYEAIGNDQPNYKGDPGDADEGVLLSQSLVIQRILLTPRQERNSTEKQHLSLATQSTKEYVMSSLTVAVETFPKLFNVAQNMDALVVDHMLVHNGEVDWDMNLIRLVHDWEVDVVSSLFNALYSVRLGQGNENKLCWSPSKTRSFEVKTFYKVLLPIVDFSFPCVVGLA
jgi:hypothetical protein